MADFEVVLESGYERDTWLAKRRLGIGASDTPALLNQSNWGSPFSVCVDKLGLSEEQSRDYMTWGKTIEGSLRDYLVQDQDFINEYGADWKAVEDQRLIRSKQWPWLQCTLDAWAVPPPAQHRKGILTELKNSRDYDAWRDGFPEYVKIQVQHQMAVTGEGQALIVASVGGAPPAWYPVERDNEFIEKTIVPVTKEFWEAILRGDFPDVDDHNATTEAIRALCPVANGHTIRFPSSLQEVDDRYEELHYQKKEIEDEMTGIKNRFRAALGAASVGILPSDKRWTCNMQKASTFTVNRKGSRVLRGPRRSKRG